jgi:hypothetical protein
LAVLFPSLKNNFTHRDDGGWSRLHPRLSEKEGTSSANQRSILRQTLSRTLMVHSLKKCWLKCPDTRNVYTLR